MFGALAAWLVRRMHDRDDSLYVFEPEPDDDAWGPFHD